LRSRALEQLLSKYNVLSAPVLDKERNQYIGFVDMVDLAAFIVDIYTETDILGENFLSLLEQGERFTTTKVKDLISTHPLHPRPPSPGAIIRTSSPSTCLAAAAVAAFVPS
jgi:hypothetical protein